MQKRNYYFYPGFKHGFMSWDDMFNLHNTCSGLCEFNRFFVHSLNLFDFLCIFIHLRSHLERLLQEIYGVSGKNKNPLIWHKVCCSLLQSKLLVYKDDFTFHTCRSAVYNSHYTADPLGAVAIIAFIRFLGAWGFCI